MADLFFNGTQHELMDAISELPRILAGQLPDRGGVVAKLKERICRRVLLKIYESYMMKSEGGVGLDGIKWKPLAASTLSIISLERSQKNVKKLKEKYDSMSPAKKKLWHVQSKKLAKLLAGKDEPSRRSALNILEKQRASGRITQSFYESTVRKLALKQSESEKTKTAIEDGFSDILVDTEALLNSFYPGDSHNIIRQGNGWIEGGSDIPYVVYHQSAASRITKSNGEPVLPRRQIFPDDKMPESWKKDIMREIKATLSDRNFWIGYFMGKAS